MITARELSIKILNKILKGNGYSNIVLNSELNKCKFNTKDRALVTEIVYGTLKHKYTIDRILKHYVRGKIEKLDYSILNNLRVAIYQLRFLDKIPEFATVNEAVKIAKKHNSIPASKLVNGVLRNYLRLNSTTVYYNKSNILDRLCFEYSFDEWLVNLFVKQYGSIQAEKILKGLNETPALTVRVNTLKTDFENAFNQLQEEGYNIEKGINCDQAIRIIRGSNIENNELFKKGHITVQDESAMLVAPLMDLDLNLTVLDLCSAPGGKSTHISEIMKNTGKVMAYDIHDNKLKLVNNNKNRLGISNLTTGIHNAEELNENLVNKIDRVLIDVPCSGLGIIRKKPEIKWSITREKISNIISVQRNIMKNAAQYLKKNGILLYSTCTLNKEENEKNIKWFLNNFSNFTLEKIDIGNSNNIIYDKQGFATILPNKYMDGFFIAKLKKQW